MEITVGKERKKELLPPEKSGGIIIMQCVYFCLIAYLELLSCMVWKI